MTQAPGGSAVHMRSLSKLYGRERVVDAFSATIEAGTFFSLLGPSGSGKTTTLMMIAGFVQADEGQILVEGRDLAPVPPQKRGFGMVFQNYAIFPHMNVAENVAFPLRARGMGKAEVAERVSWALDMVRLRALSNRYAKEISGGQQQRVAIARAIVFHPKIVLMDEPLGALDKNLRLEMQAEIRDIQQRLGMTVIYVTHDQGEALTMSDQVAIMNRGRVEQIGPPRAVYERPANGFVGKFLGEANLLEGTVASVSDSGTLFRMVDGTLLRAGSMGVATGPVRLFVRPEKLDFASGPEDGHTNRVQGAVRRVSFLGNHLRCDVGLADGQAMIVDLPNSRGGTPPAPGDAVTLSWAVADTLVLLA